MHKLEKRQEFRLEVIALAFMLLLVPTQALCQRQVSTGNTGSVDAQSIKEKLDEQAKEIEKRILAKGPHFAIEGKLAVHGPNSFSISGVRFISNKNTRTYGELVDGAIVKAVGYTANKQKIARVIKTGDKSKTQSTRNSPPAAEMRQLSRTPYQGSLPNRPRRPLPR